MIEVNTFRNRPKDGKNMIAIVCDDEQFSLLMSDITFNRECIIRPIDRKPADASPSAGKDSFDSFAKGNNSDEPVSDTTIAISPRAIAEIKKLVTDCERGRALRRLINGEIITSDEYRWINNLKRGINRIVQLNIFGKTKVRCRDGRRRTGYFLRFIPTIQ